MPGEENVQVATRGLRVLSEDGRITLMVVPRPVSLRMRMSPPCSRTICRELNMLQLPVETRPLDTLKPGSKIWFS